MQEKQAVLAFNRGVLSELALARTDIARYKMAAAKMVNWMPRLLGSMMLRPGTQYITGTAANGQVRVIPFVFSATDTARIEVSSASTRVLVNDAPVTRVAVSTAVANGSFGADLSSWTDASEAGATVSWLAASSVGFVGTGTNNAILDQQVPVAVGDQGKRHALRIIVNTGPITFRCGTSEGDDSYINETVLNTGTHSLALTPSGDFWIRFENVNQAQSILGSCTVEAAGVMDLGAFITNASDLQSMRWDQSGDITYIGCNGYVPYQIERRATDSWSVVKVMSTLQKGPFRTINTGPITLTPSAISGNITITASKPLFRSGHVGALFRVSSVGQLVQGSLTAASQATNPIQVTGVGSQRGFSVNVSGTWSGQWALQYSVGAPGSWITITTQEYTGNLSSTYTDGLDNQTIYYRVICLAYTSGTIVVSLSISSGSINGIVRITDFTDSQHVSASVLTALGSTAPSSLWYEGAWSTYRGFPTVPKLFGGRLWWFGTGLYGSVSDDYTNFDETTIGDSGPIIGQLDSGPIDNIQWALSLQQLVLGTASAETSLRSTYLADPITPTNFNTMTGSTQGSANVMGQQLDRYGIMVQVTEQRVYQLELDIYTYSYRSSELTVLVPNFNNAGIVNFAIQRKPDTRIHFVRADGTVGVMVFDSSENVNCWCEVQISGGFVEDVTVLPPLSGNGEDQVYYVVRRTVNGSTVHYHEKWTLESECTGLPVCKTLDAHIVYSGAATTTIGGLSHLIGQTVSVWGWNTVTPYIDGNGNKPGIDMGTYVVDNSGQITGLKAAGSSYPVTNAVIGLPYTAQFQSMKRVLQWALDPSGLGQVTRAAGIALLLQNTGAQQIKFGADFDHLDDIPQMDLPENQAGTAQDIYAILNSYDKQLTSFDDIYSTDSRLCLQASSPGPANVLAAIVRLGDE